MPNRVKPSISDKNRGSPWAPLLVTGTGKCRRCGKIRDLKEGTVKTLDPETNLPWGKVKALVCKDCNLLDVIEKLPDPK